MEDKDRGPNKAGLKKLCTMAKAILPPTSHSTPDSDVEMHNLQSDTTPQATTETASASDINYYVEKEKESAPMIGKHGVSTKRRASQITQAADSVLESTQSAVSDVTLSVCLVDQRDNDENSSTATQGDKEEPGKSINPIKTEIPNPVIKSTTEENVEVTAAGATANFDFAVKSKKQFTKKSLQKSQEMKSSNGSTGQKQQTVNQSTTNTKPSTKSKLVSTTRSTKMTPNAPIKKNVGESNNKTEESIPQVTSIRKIEKSTVVYKPKPVAAPSKHENSTRPNKKNKKSEIAPISASVFSGENSITSSSQEILTDDDSGDSMQVQFSWDGASALVPATEDEPSNLSNEYEASKFVEKSLEDVKDFRLSSKAKKLAAPVEGDESINALLAPKYEAIKTPVEPFLTEKDVSDIVSMKKKTQKARVKYISSQDSVFTIDTNWATAPNAIFDIEHQPIRPDTAPGRINFGMNFYKESRQDLPSKRLQSEPRPDDNQIQERKRCSRSANWRSHDNAYAEAPVLYSLVVLEPVTPPNEIETDVEITPKEPSLQNVHEFETLENLENLPSAQIQNKNSASSPVPHSPNKEDPTMENLPSPSRDSADSSRGHRSQPSKDSEPAEDNSSKDTITTFRRRGSAKQEELKLDNIEDKTASPIRTISPGIFWNFFQLFGSVLNIFRPRAEESNTNAEKDKERQIKKDTNLIDNDVNGQNSGAGCSTSQNNTSSDEEKDRTKNYDNQNVPPTMRSIGNGNENGNKRKNEATTNQSIGESTNGIESSPYRFYKDLFTCFTNKMYWFGVCPNKVEKPLSKFVRRIIKILAIIILVLSFLDSIAMVKVFGLIFIQSKELHDLVALVFFIGHACTKGYFLFMVTFRWYDLTAFVPMHRNIMSQCCDEKTLEAQTKNNEVIGDLMSVSTIIVALAYALMSKFDLQGSVMTLGKNLRVNAAVVDCLAFLWEADESRNRTNAIMNHHVQNDIMSYETAAKGVLGESMQFASEAHDSLMLDIIFAIVFCLHLTTLIVVKQLKRAIPEGQDPAEFTNGQWMLYNLLRLMTKTINCTFGILWLFMNYRNLLLIANFGFQIVYMPGQVVFWFQGSDIAKLVGIYYFGINTYNQNTHIKEWIRGICSGKTEVKLDGQVYNVIVLLDDVDEHPIGFGVGRSFINNDFIFGVIEKVASFFIMLVSFHQKPCECEKICQALAKTFADTLNILSKH